MNRTTSTHSSVPEPSISVVAPPGSRKFRDEALSESKISDIPSPRPLPPAKAAPRSARIEAPGRRVQASAASRFSTTTRKASRSGRDRSSVACELATQRDGEAVLSKTVAASDDAKHPTAAGIAPKGSSRAGRSSRDRQKTGAAANAAAARSRQESENQPMLKSSPAENTQSKRSNDQLKVPTDLAALEDGPSYVRAVAAKVDMVGASAQLVVSQDEKIAKAELDRLRELIFGKGGPFQPDEPVRIDWSAFPQPRDEPPSNPHQSKGERDDN